MPTDYVMKISRLTVDKLGVRLYDRVSAVIAELVANSYDADATKVMITAPMGELLANKQAGKIIDKGMVIEVTDNGTGMTPSEVNDFYLKVGAERRIDPRRGDRSPGLKRAVMGRKGVGKLAPFGICRRIEVISSGGALVERQDEAGNRVAGYVTAHLVLDRDEILNDTDEDYKPELGSLDETLRADHGATIRLTGFAHRWVPSIDEFSRQLSQRFGIPSADWQIELTDSTKAVGDPLRLKEVGSFEVDQMAETTIRFVRAQESSDGYAALDASGGVMRDLRAGFDLDARFYGVTGWVAYASTPYKDDLMAGVRIYCHGKIAAQTALFNLRAGFTGEHDVRSYLIGELHADWLDEEEDLIQTDRRDILWSHEIGQAFEVWGQTVVKKMGAITRAPLRAKGWEQFRVFSRIEDRVKEAFPLDEQFAIRTVAIDIAKLIGRTMRGDEMADTDCVESVVQLSLDLAPHVTLGTKLREAAESQGSPLAVITGILKTARVAELSSFGRIAADRVKVIETVEALKDEAATLEKAFQDLITQAPWLIDPQWSPIAANQTFSTLRTEFQKFYREHTGEDIELDDFSDPLKRADFVLANQEQTLELIEIKRPHHAFQNEEMERMNTYVDLMDEFLSLPQNAEFKRHYPNFHVTLVCDDEKLTGVHKTAFESLCKRGTLSYISWRSFLLRTRRVHQSFLDENERQKRGAARGV